MHTVEYCCLYFVFFLFHCNNIICGVCAFFCLIITCFYFVCVSVYDYTFRYKPGNDVCVSWLIMLCGWSRYTAILQLRKPSYRCEYVNTSSKNTTLTVYILCARNILDVTRYTTETHIYFILLIRNDIANDREVIESL